MLEESKITEKLIKRTGEDAKYIIPAMNGKLKETRKNLAGRKEENSRVKGSIERKH